MSLRKLKEWVARILYIPPELLHYIEEPNGQLSHWKFFGFVEAGTGTRQLANLKSAAVESGGRMEPHFVI